MNLREWDARYRASEAAFETPVPLLARFAAGLRPGAALDLACGAGRNAIHLAGLGWNVTAVDGSAAAVEILRERAAARGVRVEAIVADLESDAFAIQPAAFDLVCGLYYLQRSLFARMKAGARPGAVAISIVHLAGAEETRGTPKRAYPGELPLFFEGWEILHYREGMPAESCHRRAVAEIVARRPAD